MQPHTHPHVFRHAVRVEHWNALATRATSSTLFAGSVSTIPAIVEAPTGVTYNPDDGNAYVLDGRPSLNASVLVQVAPSGATRLFATLPGYVTRRIAYDQALKKFFFTYAQNSANQSGIASVDQKGNVAFVAGGGPPTQVDGTGSLASFSQNLGGITVDTNNGTLYVNDGNLIRAVTPSGTVSTLTQPGTIGGPYGGVGDVAYNASDDALYVADPGTTSIKRVAPTTGSVSTLAGQCLSLEGFSQCDPLQRDGLGTRGLFGLPTNIAIDSQSKLIYVSDSADASIRRIDALGNVSTLAGNGVIAHLDGTGQSAEFTNPAALMLNTVNHNLTVLDLSSTSGVITPPTLRAVRITGATPPPLNTPITLFDPMSLDPGLFGINWLQTAHPPAALVYDGFDANHSFVGLISTAGVTSEHVDTLSNQGFFDQFGPYDVRYAYDDTQWTFENSNLLGRRALGGSPSAVVIGTGQTYTIGTHGQLAAASNGDMWFVIPQTGVVGHVTPAAKVYEFTAASAQSSSASIAIASNGIPWVVTNNQIIEFALTGKVLIDDSYAVDQITTGPDGNIWFTQSDAIGTIRPDNTIVLYPIIAPVPNCTPGLTSCSRQISAITTGSDGALWVTELGAIGRLTTSGVFSEFPILAARTAPSAISPGPDGNIWFIDAGAKKIGRLAIH